MTAGQETPIREAAVLGAGVMGSAIAAHLANAGVRVHLLDVVPEAAADRDSLAQTAVQKLLKQDPAPFTHRRNARRVIPGNLEDHLERLSGCDWIVEAVVERLEVKQDLYRRVEAVRKAGSVVSSNTSTLPLAALTDGLPESFRRDFLITHFFNPPRYMRLLELVAGPETEPAKVDALAGFADRTLGKTAIRCNDTPGFVANRIGVFWLTASLVHALDMGITVEEADAVIGRPFGIPKTGVFGLMDLVGLDLVPHVVGSLRRALPANDPFHRLDRDLPVLRQMIEAGYTGRKGKGGFYRRTCDAEGRRVTEAVDLAEFTYRPAVEARPDCLDAAKEGGVAGLLQSDDRVAAYARRVMGQTLAYAASLIPEIHDDPAAVDEAVRLGYNWKQGPFELIDAVGAARLAAMLEAEGAPVPAFLRQLGAGTVYRVADGRLQALRADGAYHTVDRPEGVLRLADVKRRSERVAGNGSASLWDLGDGVACLEFHTKMNAIDDGIMEMIHTSVATVAERFRALVLHNEGSNFSAGANLGVALFAANIAAWDRIERMVQGGQEAYRRLRYAPFPVVGAPAGMALGGGCEVLLHCDGVQAHMESYLGLVEPGVGVIPAWGGCTRMLARLAADPKRPKGPMPPTSKAFETISVATVARSAEEAREHGFLGADDRITMNRERVLAEAKAFALELAEGYRPPEPAGYVLPGPSGKAALDLAVDSYRHQGKTTPHDLTVADRLATVLSGGAADPTEERTEEDLLALERQAFMQLIRTEPTLARIEHMLETGQPLRN